MRKLNAKQKKLISYWARQGCERLTEEQLSTLYKLGIYENLDTDAERELREESVLRSIRRGGL